MIEVKKHRYQQMMLMLDDEYANRKPYSDLMKKSLWDKYFKFVHSSLYAPIGLTIITHERFPPLLPQIRKLTQMVIEEQAREKGETYRPEDYIDIDMWDCKYCHDSGMTMPEFKKDPIKDFFCTSCEVRNQKWSQLARTEILETIKARREGKLTLKQAYEREAERGLQERKTKTKEKIIPLEENKNA